VTGKEQKAEGSRQKAVEDTPAPQRPVLTAFCLLPSAYSRRGFTLLELMIVISIIIILALIVLPSYNRTVQASKEAVLRDDLQQMRKMIDQYAADKGKLPASLRDLVEAGYLHEIPDDPMTEPDESRGEANWYEVAGEDPSLLDGGSGIINVCSSSSEEASDGSRYNDCDRW
jgi:general secretion pathway protein G